MAPSVFFSVGNGSKWRSPTPALDSLSFTNLTIKMHVQVQFYFEESSKFFPSVHFFGLFATGNSLITRPSDYFGEGRVAFPEGREGRSNTDSGGWVVDKRLP